MPADPELIDASQLPVDEQPAPPPPYPRELVKRPLLLPPGRHEVGFSVGMGEQRLEELAVRYARLTGVWRLSLGLNEIYAGMMLVPVHGEALPMGAELDIPVLQHLYAGTKLAIAEETALGIQALLGTPGRDTTYYSPTLYVTHRFHPSDRGALEISGGVDYAYQRQPTGYGAHFGLHRLAAFASGAAELQMTSVVALRVAGNIAQYKYTDSRGFIPPESFRSHSYSGSLQLSVTENVDLTPFFTIEVRGPLKAVGGGLGVAVR